MKRIIFCSLLLLVLVSCKKNLEEDSRSKYIGSYKCSRTIYNWRMSGGFYTYDSITIEVRYSDAEFNKIVVNNNFVFFLKDGRFGTRYFDGSFYRACPGLYGRFYSDSIYFQSWDPSCESWKQYWGRKINP